VTALIISGLRGEESSASSAGIALIWFGLLFGVLVTLGRAYLGIVAASQSRYTSFTLIILAGVYLAILGRTPRRLSAKKTLWSLHDQIALRVARVVVLLAIALQVSVGFPDGYSHEIPNYADFAKAATVLRHIDHERNYDVAYYLCFFESDASIRQRAHFLKVHQLSVFANQSPAGRPERSMTSYKEGGLSGSEDVIATTIGVGYFVVQVLLEKA
jgi:hypothetical protein